MLHFQILIISCGISSVFQAAFECSAYKQYKIIQLYCNQILDLVNYILLMRILREY